MRALLTSTVTSFQVISLPWLLIDRIDVPVRPAKVLPDVGTAPLDAADELGSGCLKLGSCARDILDEETCHRPCPEVRVRLVGWTQELNLIPIGKLEHDEIRFLDSWGKPKPPEEGHHVVESRAANADPRYSQNLH
jgi:hypothetical protein